MNKYSLLLFVVIMVTPVWSCKSGVAVNDRKDITDRLIGKELFCSDLLGNSFVGIVGDTVIMEFYSSPKLCGVFIDEGDTLTKVTEILYKGRGPYEFLNPMMLVENDSLCIVDRDGRGVRKICHIPVDAIASPDNNARWRIEDLSWCGTMNVGSDFLLFDDRRILLSGDEYGRENVLTVIDASCQTKIPLAYWISDGYSGNVIPKQSIYTDNATLCRKGDKILYACGEGRYMELFRLTGNGITDRKTIYAQCPEYVDRDGINYGVFADGNRGIKACATNKYIYAVLRGPLLPSRKYKGYPGYYYDEIEVYDWDGNFVRNYQTAQPFMTMSVTDDDSTLYTISVDLDTMEPEIVKYMLHR